jgi:hypothetical protein
MWPLDDPGDIRHHHRAPFGQLDDAEVRLEGGERVVGDLGSRRRHRGEQRALAGVGLADESDIGDQLELELDATLDAGPAGLVLARHLVGGGSEGGVAPAAAAALCDDAAVAGLQQLAQELARVGIPHHGARRNAQHHVITRGTLLILPLPVLATLRLILLLVLVVEQGRQVGIGDQHDVPAVAAVAAIGATAGHVLLAAEGQATVPTVAALYVDDRVIDEHG